MFRHLMQSIVLAVLVSGTALAASNPPSAPEWNVETSTMVTSLPARVPGSMTARSCMECKGVEVYVTDKSKLLTDETEVSLVELRKAAQNKHFMMVFYNSATREVTRIVIHGVPKAKPAK